QPARRPPPFSRRRTPAHRQQPLRAAAAQPRPRAPELELLREPERREVVVRVPLAHRVVRAARRRAGPVPRAGPSTRPALAPAAHARALAEALGCDAGFAPPGRARDHSAAVGARANRGRARRQGRDRCGLTSGLLVDDEHLAAGGPEPGRDDLFGHRPTGPLERAHHLQRLRPKDLRDEARRREDARGRGLLPRPPVRPDPVPRPAHPRAPPPPPPRGRPPPTPPLPRRAPRARPPRACGAPPPAVPPAAGAYRRSIARNSATTLSMSTPAKLPERGAGVYARALPRTGV